MEKKNLDWANIGFAYMPTDMRYVSNYKDGAWDEGTLTADSNVAVFFRIALIHIQYQGLEQIHLTGIPEMVALAGAVPCLKRISWYRRSTVVYGSRSIQCKEHSG